MKYALNQFNQLESEGCKSLASNVQTLKNYGCVVPSVQTARKAEIESNYRYLDKLNSIFNVNYGRINESLKKSGEHLEESYDQANIISLIHDAGQVGDETALAVLAIVDNPDRDDSSNIYDDLWNDKTASGENGYGERSYIGPLALVPQVRHLLLMKIQVA